MRGTQNTSQQKRRCWFDGHCLKEKDNIVPFVKRKAFFLLRVRHLLFLSETSGSFCKFNSFLFIYLFFKNLILNLFIRSLQYLSSLAVHIWKHCWKFEFNYLFNTWGWIVLNSIVHIQGQIDKGKIMKYYIYQPLRSGRIWHKVNFFKRSLTGLNSEFSFT